MYTIQERENMTAALQPPCLAGEPGSSQETPVPLLEGHTCAHTRAHRAQKHACSYGRLSAPSKKCAFDTIQGSNEPCHAMELAKPRTEHTISQHGSMQSHTRSTQGERRGVKERTVHLKETPMKEMACKSHKGSSGGHALPGTKPKQTQSQEKACYRTVKWKKDNRRSSLHVFMKEHCTVNCALRPHLMKGNQQDEKDADIKLKTGGGTNKCGKKLLACSCRACWATHLGERAVCSLAGVRTELAGQAYLSNFTVSTLSM